MDIKGFKDREGNVHQYDYNSLANSPGQPDLSGYLQKTELPAAIDTALAQAKESGAFDGPQGEPGTDGKSAYEYAVDGGYTGTEEEFAEKLASEGSGGNADLSITGATVGQTVKITEVDENGVPTAWESVNFPSGEMRLIADVTTTEDVTKITISEDKDGNPFTLRKVAVRVKASGATGAGGYIGFGVNGGGSFKNLGLTADSTRDYAFYLEVNEDGTYNGVYGGGLVSNIVSISGMAINMPESLSGIYADGITSIHAQTGTPSQIIATGARFIIYGA